MSYYAMKRKLALRLAEIYDEMDRVVYGMENIRSNTDLWYKLRREKQKLELEMKTIQRKLNDN